MKKPSIAEPALRLADLMRQGLARAGAGQGRKAKKPAQPRPIVACDGCENWHQKGKHIADAATRRANSARYMAERIRIAEERFLAFARDVAGLSLSEAERALAVYRKARVIKIDPVTGQFTFKHGDFAEPDVLRRAARQ